MARINECPVARGKHFVLRKHPRQAAGSVSGESPCRLPAPGPLPREHAGSTFCSTGGPDGGRSPRAFTKAKNPREANPTAHRLQATKKARRDVAPRAWSNSASLLTQSTVYSSAANGCLGRQQGMQDAISGRQPGKSGTTPSRVRCGPSLGELRFPPAPAFRVSPVFQSIPRCGRYRPIRYRTKQAP